VKRFSGAAFSVLLIALLSACSRHDAATYQGYVEGEFVYLGSSQGDKLTALSVSRGQTVKANASLFSLESDDEAHALAQAQQQLASARAQLADIRTGKRVPEVDVNSVKRLR
jgi:HlyD family secretion protein